MMIDFDGSESGEQPYLPLWVVWIGVIGIITAFFWCTAASSYAVEVEGRGLNEVSTPRRMGAQSLLFFLASGVFQIPSFPWVISHCFRNAIWIPIAFVGVQGLAVIGFCGFTLLEKKLDDEPKKKKKKSKLAKIATPKPIDPP